MLLKELFINFLSLQSYQINYLKISGILGFLFGIGASITYLIDLSNKNRRIKKTIYEIKKY